METRTPSVGMSRGRARASARALAPESFQSRPRKKTEKQLLLVVLLLGKREVSEGRKVVVKAISIKSAN